MKNFKRVISVALCALLMVSMLATCQISFTFAASADGYTYVVDSVTETVTVTGYEGTEVELTIPGTIDGKSVTAIAADAFRNNSTVTSVTVPASVKTVGDSAFRNCAKLVAVTMPSGNYTLGHAVFANDVSLQVLDLGKATETGIGVLSGCNALTTLSINAMREPINGAGTIALLFDGNATPANPGIPATLETIVVTNDGNIPANAFKGVSGLKSITFAKKITAVGDSAFEGCAVLSAITGTIAGPIGNKAFYGCKALTAIDLSNAGVKNIGVSAFEGCVALADIIVSDSLKYVDKNAVKNTKWLSQQSEYALLGQVFVAYCGTKSELVLPADAKYVANSALENNKTAETVEFPGTVEYIGTNVLKGSAVVAVTIPFLGAFANDSETAFISYLFGGAGSDENGKVLPECLLQVKLTGGTEIPADAFADCKNLMYIYIPETVTKIGARALANCTALNTLYYKAVSATVDSTALNGTTVDVVEFGSKVEVIPTYLCTANSKLLMVKIPKSVKTIETRAFAGCYNLVNITFDAENCTSVASDAFDYCHKLEEISLTDRVEYIPANLFVQYGSSDLEEITIPAAVTEIAAGAFKNCVSLKTVNFLAANCVIGDDAFSACAKLTTINIGDNVTTIPTNLFTNSTAVKKVNVPAQITRIEDYAFKGCTALEEITVPDGLRSIGKAVMAGSLWYDNQPVGPVYLGKIFYGYKGTMSDDALTLLDGTVAIADGALEGNGALQTLTIPGSVEHIGKDALAMTNTSIINNSGSKVVADYATENEIPVLTTCAHADAYYVIVEEATATAEGQLDVYCRDCGEKFAKETYATEEDLLFMWILKSKPTCTVPGVLEMNTGAGAPMLNTLPATGHLFTTAKVTVAPTCNSLGVTNVFCDDCGVQLEGQAGTVPMLAHTPGEWIKVRLPRTYCTGLNAVLCTVCGATVQNKVLPKLKEENTLIVDVTEEDWHMETVIFVMNNNLFSGISENYFAPDDKMTRAMFVTVLGRLEGVEVENNVKTPFTDVKKKQYYTGYIKWAAENGIVSGMTKTTFAPDAEITREQICALIVRYAAYAGIELDNSTETELFRDADMISGYALDSVLLCHKAGIVTGRGGGYFAPKSTATRAEVAQVFKNLCLGYLAE